MGNSKFTNRRHSKHEPTIAPSLEMDDLERDASEEDIRNNNYTPVTKLVIDRLPDNEE